jgi:predicted N-formylglutamate amidohydrolase
MQLAEYFEGEAGSPLLILADHASNHVPSDLNLGIDPRLMDEHIAIDIGVEPLAHALRRRLGCPALLARVSRLVVDLNREEGELGAIPAHSDGHEIPGNAALDDAGRKERLERFWRPYHHLIDERIDRNDPRMLVALHSFTPRLASRPEEERPWQVGMLYNQDDRAARIAIAALRRAGVTTGDNEPYSGRVLNATMNRHAEARGLPYLGFELRQDLISSTQAVEKWANVIASVVQETLDALG